MNTTTNMNNTMIKLMEEMNIGVTVYSRTRAFEQWVSEIVNIVETFLNSDKGVFDYWLSNREPIREDDFNKRFQFEYATINEFMEEAQWRFAEANIPATVLDDAISQLKKAKAKVRKVKAEYKQAFAELRGAIRLAKENENHAQETTTLVEQLVIQWCSTHEIVCYFKEQFEGTNLAGTIERITDWLLSSKLYPSEDEVRAFVEKCMKQYTVMTA